MTCGGTMSFLEDLHNDIEKAREENRRSNVLLEHASFCMSEAATKYSKLSFERRGEDGLLYFKDRWRSPCICKAKPSTRKGRINMYSYTKNTNNHHNVEVSTKDEIEFYLRSIISHWLT